MADLLFVLTRSTVNYSLIAYQARRTAGGPRDLDPKQPVDAYWLDIDYGKLPSKKGKPHDKVDIDVFGWSTGSHRKPSPPDVTGVRVRKVRVRRRQCSAGWPWRPLGDHDPCMPSSSGHGS